MTAYSYGVDKIQIQRTMQKLSSLFTFFSAIKLS